MFRLHRALLKHYLVVYSMVYTERCAEVEEGGGIACSTHHHTFTPPSPPLSLSLLSPPLLSQSLSKEVSQLREQYSEQRTKCEVVEQLRSREVGEGAERIARLTTDKRKLEERLKVGQQGKWLSCSWRRTRRYSLASFPGRLVNYTVNARLEKIPFCPRTI